jgi:hypothetical protein
VNRSAKECVQWWALILTMFSLWFLRELCDKLGMSHYGYGVWSGLNLG